MICNKCGKNNPIGVEVCPACGEEMPGSVNCGGFGDILSYTPEEPKDESVVAVASDTAGRSDEAEKAVRDAARLVDRLRMGVFMNIVSIGMCVLCIFLLIVSCSEINKSKDFGEDASNSLSSVLVKMEDAESEEDFEEVKKSTFGKVTGKKDESESEETKEEGTQEEGTQEEETEEKGTQEKGTQE